MTAQTNSLSITEPKGTSSRPSYGDRAIIVLALICTFIAFSPFGYAILTSFKSEWKDGSIIPFVQFEPDMSKIGSRSLALAALKPCEGIA